MPQALVLSCVQTSRPSSTWPQASLRKMFEIKSKFLSCHRVKVHLKWLLSDGLRFCNRLWWWLRFTLQVAEKLLLSPGTVFWSDLNSGLFLSELLPHTQTITRDELLPKIETFSTEFSEETANRKPRFAVRRSPFEVCAKVDFSKAFLVWW